MIRDPIVDEVRSIREELAATFDFDIRKIVEDAQRRQATSQLRIVSFEKPNQSLQPTEAAAIDGAVARFLAANAMSADVRMGPAISASASSAWPKARAWLRP